MSRCYPYPPPGYEKKAAQPPEIVPETKKEKHKHKDKDREKDKEKKKKRKRDDNAKDESSHKDKRSSKHQKAAAAGNDIGVHPANGRVQQQQQQQQAEPAFVAADRLLDSKQEPAQGLFQVDKTRQDIGEQQSREASASVVDRTGTGTGREAADRAGHSGSSATSTSCGRAPESSRGQPPVKKDREKEANGKLPIFKPLLDTGQPRQQQQQQQQPQQQQQQQKQQPQQQKQQQRGKSTGGALKPIVRTTEAVANAGPVQSAGTDVAEKAEKGDKAEKIAEEEKKRSEKEEKRSKLLELQPVNNLDEDDKLEWLFPNKRKEATADKGDAGAGVVVWAEPAFMSSADIYAMPYVVPY